MKKTWYKIISLKSLSVLVLCALGALPLLVNHRPLIMYTGVNYIFPAFFTYTDHDLGGHTVREMDYSNVQFQKELGQNGGWILWPLVRHSGTSVDEGLAAAPAPPDASHILGADAQGRDVLAVLLYALRRDLAFALFISVLSLCFGTFLGSLQGYAGGAVDLLGQRVGEVWASMPEMIIVLLMVDSGKVSMFALCVWVAVFHSLRVAQSVRIQVFKARSYGYVAMARIMGLGGLHIFRHHILPSVVPILRAKAPFEVSYNLSFLSALTFFYGSLDSYPTLGELLHQGRVYFFCAPWILWPVLVALICVVVTIAFLTQQIRKREGG